MNNNNSNNNNNNNKNILFACTWNCPEFYRSLHKFYSSSKIITEQIASFQILKECNSFLDYIKLFVNNRKTTSS